MTLNQIGLAIDIVGFLLLFFFGMPSGYIEDPENAGNLSWGSNPEPIKNNIVFTNKVIKICSYIGFILVLIGFILQFIAAF